MWKQDGIWACTDCDYTSKNNSNVYEHIEGKHVSNPGYICLLYNKICSIRKALRCHKYRNHKNTNMFLLKVVEYALYVTKHQRKIQRFMNILSQSMWKVRVTYVQNVVQSVSLGRHWYAILEDTIQNPKLDQTAVTVIYVEKLLTTLKG